MSSVGDYQYKGELKGEIPTLDDSSIVTRYNVRAMILSITSFSKLLIVWHGLKFKGLFTRSRLL